MITKGDKGGATITQGINSYIQEAMRELGKTNFHRKLLMNATLEYNVKINTVIVNLK